MSNELMKQINLDKTNKRIKNSDVARELQVSPGAVTQFFREDEQIRIGLLHFTKLIEFIYENDVETKRERLFEFCRKTKRPENLRIAMEYAHMNGESLFLQYIVAQDLDGKRPNDEWASVYQLLLKRSMGELNGAALLRATEALMSQRKLKTNEMRILVNIIKMYAYFEMEEHGSMLKLTKELPVEINTIRNPYIKEAFRVRMLEAYAHGYLRDNDLENARNAALELTSDPNSTKFPMCASTGYHVLGQSYLFEDFEQVENNIKASMDVLSDLASPRVIARRSEIKKTYDFSKVHWSKDVDEKMLYDEGERLHFLVSKGKKEEAYQLINELELKNGKLSAFQVYYKGLIENDPSLLRRSLELFRKQGNKFYLRLPLTRLQELSKDRDEKLELIW